MDKRRGERQFPEDGKVMQLDCDNDTFLFQVKPIGPTCHKGTDTCWAEKNDVKPMDSLSTLEETIANRKENSSSREKLCGHSMFGKGINKIAQKVGEEAIEMVIESKDNNDDTVS